MTTGGDSGPYRRSLPQVRQVFCGDCRHHHYYGNVYHPHHKCVHPKVVVVRPVPPDPVYGPQEPVTESGECRTINANLDCKLFAPLVLPEPLWARLFRWLCRHPKGQ